MTDTTNEEITASGVAAGIGQIDHVALGVHDLDERIAFLTGTLGMRLIRIGVYAKTGGRIAMIGDGAGFKLELMELPDEPAGFQHVAYRVEDVDAAYASLLERGCKELRAPRPIAAAKAMSALVEDPSGMQVQVIKYAPDSPDI